MGFRGVSFTYVRRNVNLPPPGPVPGELAPALLADPHPVLLVGDGLAEKGAPAAGPGEAEEVVRGADVLG